MYSYQLSTAQESGLGVDLGSVIVSSIGQADETLLISDCLIKLYQSGRRNTDGLIAHRRATIQPTDGLLNFRLKNVIFRAPKKCALL